MADCSRICCSRAAALRQLPLVVCCLFFFFLPPTCSSSSSSSFARLLPSRNSQGQTTGRQGVPQYFIRSALDTSNSSSSSSSLGLLLGQDKDILIQLKTSLQQLSASISSNLSDWSADSASNPCDWSRIGCSVWQGVERVSKVDLSGLNLKGHLVSNFSHLTALSNLNLSHNELGGSISQDIFNCTQLSSLDLSTNNFSGIIPQGFAGLSNLQVLNLGGNSFTGSVYTTLPSGCGQLQSLNLSGNSFDEYSYPWANCTSLLLLDLSKNNLTGLLPSDLGKIHSLQQLLLRSNQIVGSIPDSLLSPNASLQQLDLSENNLTGTLPPTLVNCSSSLLQLDLSKNYLTGSIPPQVANCSSLEELNLSENLLSGSIPSEIGRLGNLRVLMVGSNNLTGAIPSELTGCKSLNLLDLNTNHLGGSLPTFLGEMQSLEYLVLHSNNFSGSMPVGSMVPSELRFLDLSNNTLSGPIPGQLANLPSLQFLLLAANHLSGEIPPELGNVSGLQFLDLSSNNLTGSIPSSFGKLQNLLWLTLAYNGLTGQIPHELGNCTSLRWLNVRSNHLSGELPDELAQMGSDSQAVFESNAKNINPPKALGECLMLKRWIPEDYPPFSFVYDILDRNSCKSFWIQLLTGSSIRSDCGKNKNPALGGYIQVTDNKFTGSIPEKFQGGQTSLLLLSLNYFTGSLPANLSNLPLVALNVSHNNLSGPIPDSLGENKCFTLLDFSYNNLSGPIPQSLGNLNQLTRFNISYNSFISGSVPPVGQFLTFNEYSYVNDTLLCFDTLPGMRANASDSFPNLQFCQTSGSNSSGSNQGVSTKPSKMLSSTSLLVIGVVTCLGVILCGAGGFYLVWRWPVRPVDAEFLFDEKFVSGSFSGKELNTTVCLFKGAASSPPIKQLTYSDILFATNNFDECNVVGSGGFGIVYKAELADGSTVAIKKLMHNGPQGEREFIAEMETLGTHVHENLVPLLGCCTFCSEKLLVYKFLCNGSLEDWLYEKEGGAEMLDWSRRLQIAYGTAKGLLYLHHDCSPVLIHRDMKASNILLDEEFEGYLTDFGLARELDPGYTHVSTVIAGTLGYVPPEYCQSWRATTKGDVYSFGVVLLELITGRKPLGGSENNDGSLVEWVRLLLMESRAAEAYDPVVKRTAGGDEELFEFLKLAAACTKEHPDQRPSMKEVVKQLDEMQERRAFARKSASKVKVDLHPDTADEDCV